MNNFAVLLEGVDDLTLDGLTEKKIAAAAQRAINKTARDGRVKIGRRILSQVALPKDYVQGDRLRAVYAGAGKNQAEIVAKSRNTSLARFVKGSPKVNTPGVYVAVAPGKARFMKRAFLIRLPKGNSPVTDTSNNLALAIRLRPGETLSNKTTARRVASGLYVLYGPSVDQVFRNRADSGVATDMIPELEDDLQTEFLRQLNL